MTDRIHGEKKSNRIFFVFLFLLIDRPWSPCGWYGVMTLFIIIEQQQQQGVALYVYKFISDSSLYKERSFAANENIMNGRLWMIDNYFLLFSRWPVSTLSITSHWKQKLLSIFWNENFTVFFFSFFLICLNFFSDGGGGLFSQTHQSLAQQPKYRSRADYI